jgi:hypothetical protein
MAYGDPPPQSIMTLLQWGQREGDMTENGNNFFLNEKNDERIINYIVHNNLVSNSISVHKNLVSNSISFHNNIFSNSIK